MPTRVEGRFLSEPWKKKRSLNVTSTGHSEADAGRIETIVRGRSSQQT